VGCGRGTVHRFFADERWTEVRLDIDPECSPDIVSSITDMSPVAARSFDALYSSHSLEHVYPHEVARALAEFRRVVRDDGFAMVTTPDLQSVAALVATGRLEEVAYESAAGSIAPIDMIYGLRSALAEGKTYMAHKTGFTAASLAAALRGAGFKSVVVLSDANAFNLWALAYPEVLTEERLRAELGEKLGVGV
jgi:ubiquinone/menaquinone biosynthesis C-methylase UbiE